MKTTGNENARLKRENNFLIKTFYHDPRNIQFIFHYSHASKRFVEVYKERKKSNKQISELKKNN